MNQQSREEQAAQNNAAWCDAVCRAHGNCGEFSESVWHNRRVSPKFYPNLVTLSGDEGLKSKQIGMIRDLARIIPSEGWGLKDSFASLNLKADGFSILFEAVWLWRGVSAKQTTFSTQGKRWQRIASESDLVFWEEALRRIESLDNMKREGRVFLPNLLTEPGVLLLGAYDDSGLIGGVVANSAFGVIGITNVFSLLHPLESFWMSCVAELSRRFPCMPFVTYQRCENAVLVKASGFGSTGPLKVWVHTSSQNA